MTYTKRLTQGTHNSQGWPYMSCCSLLAAVFGLPVSPLVASAQKRSLLAQLGGKCLLPINFLDFSHPEGQGPRIARLLSDPTRSLFFASIDCFDMFKSYRISTWQVRLLHVGFVCSEGIKWELSMGSLWLCTVPDSFQRASFWSLKRWANIKPSKRSRSIVA